MQINSKVYYDNKTGQVIVITGECEGTVVASTKKQDMKKHLALKDKNINEIDFIELEYGTMAATFQNAKGYHVDLETNQLKVDYYTVEELENIKSQNQDQEDLMVRIADLSEYLIDQPNESLLSIEEYIIQKEINKVMEGMI